MDERSGTGPPPSGGRRLTPRTNPDRNESMDSPPPPPPPQPADAVSLPGVSRAELLQSPLSAPRVRFRDLAVSDDALRHRLLEAVDRVLREGKLLMGPDVEALERRVADYCGTRHCVGVSSGTDAVFLALTGLGIGPGDEVITTPMSWIATLNAITIAGAAPVFVDVAADLNIDPDQIEAAITPRTKAILPVHYTGRLCDMERIRAIAAAHGLLVIEDAAQAFGAESPLGRAGGLGDAGAISLNPMKILPSYGEVGVVLVNDAAIDRRLRSLRYLGTVDKEVCVEPALNFKIDTLQAAMMLVGFDLVDANIQRRLAIARRYHDGLSGLVVCPEPPRSPSDRRCVFFDYTIRTPHRSALLQWLEGRGVEVKIRHPILMPDQPCYRHLPRPELPVASRLVQEILSLPIHEKLTDGQIDYVIEAVADFFATTGAPP